MENRSTAIAAIVAFFVMMACIGASSGQALSPSPSPSEDDCLTKLLNMSDCLSYVTAGSNLTVPDKPCCPELAGLVDSSPICLCQLLGKSDSFGINVDLNRALKLPSLCRVTTPPLNLCSVGGVPIGAPSPIPGTTSPGAGSPSSGKNDSAASGNADFILAILVGLAFAFFI